MPSDDPDACHGEDEQAVPAFKTFDELPDDESLIDALLDGIKTMKAANEEGIKGTSEYELLHEGLELYTRAIRRFDFDSSDPQPITDAKTGFIAIFNMALAARELIIDGYLIHFPAAMRAITEWVQLVLFIVSDPCRTSASRTAFA